MGESDKQDSAKKEGRKKERKRKGEEDFFFFKGKEHKSGKTARKGLSGRGKERERGRQGKNLKEIRNERARVCVCSRAR